MASVTSLDKDLRNMRLSRYTPQAAAEVRDWIEEMLREKLPSSDLLEGLKDGTALCKLVNMAVSPGVRYKQSSMPFVQMENISHFLRACQMPPLSLPPHDVFLTVDLYEAKDPAQVLQCLAAFSRRANALQPSKFPPSSWSPEQAEHAWNIHQYGYMGGASQGNQGIAFGARRQITSSSPAVPSLADKEKRRREEEDRIRQQEAEREEAAHAHQREIEEQEAQAKAEEERRWEEETAREREKERREMEEEKRSWEAEKRQWEVEEQRRAAEEKEAEERFEQERQDRKRASDARLNGQFLSQYQAGQVSAASPEPVGETAESRRIKELERELELAKQRERQYETERQGIQDQKSGDAAARISSRPNRPVPVPPKPSYDLSSLEQERRMLAGEWIKNQDMPATQEESEQAEQAPPPPRRPLPEPVRSSQPTPPVRDLPPAPRPLPNPVAYSVNGDPNRVDRYLSSNPAPTAPPPATHRVQDYSTTSEVDAENSRRFASQQKTKAGGWASKSLLEREMERERERQREWEENQKQTQAAADHGLTDTTSGTGPGQSWDVHQYGYMGGDNQNRGGHGLGIGGARRQIIGPRPPP
ncbi:hypothetical protein N7526_007633 [Penicillium atrosanguineum]|nr:hypothetical protein N7526_007633 [Penicillium atrosanguineum]